MKAPMARSKRMDFAMAWHNVMHRGARRAPIFKITDDCTSFLGLLGEMVPRFGLEVHAYSLMPNHYHLLIRSVQGRLSEGLQFLNASYTQLLNTRHQWDGPVFRGRFKSQLVTEEGHLRILIAYIHLNPMRARLIKSLRSEAWTSHRAYLCLDSCPDWLRMDTFLDLFGGCQKLHDYVQDSYVGAHAYPEDFNPETGLFLKKALAQSAEPQKPIDQASPPGTILCRHQPVEQVLARVCQLTGATLKQLKTTEAGPGANPARRFAVWALARATGLQQREIANLLRMPYYQASKVLSRIRNGDASPLLNGWIRHWLSYEHVSSVRV